MCDIKRVTMPHLVTCSHLLILLYYIQEYSLFSSRSIYHFLKVFNLNHNNPIIVDHPKIIEPMHFLIMRIVWATLICNPHFIYRTKLACATVIISCKINVGDHLCYFWSKVSKVLVKSLQPIVIPPWVQY